MKEILLFVLNYLIEYDELFTENTFPNNNTFSLKLKNDLFSGDDFV
jgi:hypothetical protein